MFLSVLMRPTKIVSIDTTLNNVNLFTQADSPSYPGNIICFINADIGSTSNLTASFQTGSSWKPGSWIYIKNNNTITGEIGRAHV